MIPQNPLPEVLAPAGSAEALTAALRCGCDAVYLGARQFSARSHAENFDDASLLQAAEQCRLCGVKLYLAINTLPFETEFAALDRLLETVAAIGADGVIVQDLGAAAYMHSRIPTLPLHASTQMTIHSPAGVRFAAQAGFSRAVLARELSETQMRACCEEAERCGIETEVFVHGAHCMCVSGQCFLSAAMGGRSANRGCCAQPCRLPFTAAEKQREYCALSLKDQSLLAHLQTMCEMGVSSLKIEGRMKRPEYVAAAVTAVKTALRGENPDLDELRAVFSRSGFTDGYFTGKRQDMFGTRQKEDVTAAQGVLQSLRAKYRQPRKAAVLDAAYTLRAGEPAKLCVTDRQCSVTVTGEIPQTAQSRPTDADALRRQFEKLGDTVYSAGRVTAEIGENLMLPASALNAMRREAVAAMDTARIAARAPKHVLAEKPQYPKCGKRVSARNFRLQIRSLAQLSALGDLRPDALLLPLQLFFAFRESPCAALFSPDAVQLLPPRFVCDEVALRRALETAYAAGYTHLACRAVGDLMLGQELGFTLHGTLGLHVTNTPAAAYLRDFGVTDALLSPEANGQAQPAAVLPLGVFACGALPVMLTRNCPVRAQAGCGKCRHALTDRRGNVLYTDCTRFTEKPDYAELFNSVPVWLADKPEVYETYAYALLSMTNESPERVREILAAYLCGAKTAPPAKFTRGLHITDG